MSVVATASDRGADVATVPAPAFLFSARKSLLKVVCAWCSSTMQEAAAEACSHGAGAAPVSHGMCEPCGVVFLAGTEEAL